jgi:hypothetical protein
VSAVERDVASVMRVALLREDAHSRIARFGRELGDQGFDAKIRPYARYLPLLQPLPRSEGGFLSVVEAMVRLLRRSPDVPEVRASDEDLVRKILSIIARPSRSRRRSAPGDGSGPSGAAPAGGLPAEVRAWEVARGETPPDPDPERKERPPGLTRKPRLVVPGPLVPARPRA